MSAEQRAPKGAEKRAERAARKKAVEQQELAALREREQREFAEQQLQQQQEQQRLALTGRPSEFTAERADAICAWVASGHSLASWCRQEGVAVSTVQRWLRTVDTFRAAYARAHDDRADALADELVDLADSVAHGTLEEIAAARLRIDTRKWVAAKLRPQRWGESPPEQQRAAVVFNIGIGARLPHSVGHTLDATPLMAHDSAPDTQSGAWGQGASD